MSGTKKEPKPKLFSPDIFRLGRGLPREGVGAKKFGMSLETREIKLFCRDIPRFCRDIPEAPKKFEKKSLCSIFVPYDVSRQKLSPHCLEAIFDSQLASPKLSPKMPPKLSLPHKRGLSILLLKINPAVRVIARQVRDKNCLAAIFAPRHQSVSSGPRGVGRI